MKKLKEYNTSKLLWPVFFALMFLKYGYYKFKYFPVLDDWIQYGSYTLEPNILENIILKSGTYMTRPFASFSDPYIWAQFWEHMHLPFFFITFLHALSAYFLYKVIKHFKLPVGLPFLIIYGLLPLGTEATYWLSASSRLVVGIFFMSLALFLLIKYIEKPKFILIFFFMITHIISMGYYEQVSILSAFLAFSILCFSFKNLKHKWHVLLPLFNFLLLLGYYQIFSSGGNVAERGQLIQGNLFEHLTEAFQAILYVFGKVQLNLMVNGLTRGLKLLIENKSFLYLSLILIVSSIVALVSYHLSKNDKHRPTPIKYGLYSLLLGFITFWVPLSINALLSVIWICNRNVFPAFIGLALMVEGVFSLIFREKIGQIIKSILLGLMAFVFIVVNISETDDYKRASEIDYNISSQIIQTFDDAVLAGKRNVIFFNGSSTYIDQNSYHHDHIHNVTTSDWALTGAVRAISKDLDVKPIIMHPWAGAQTLIADTQWFNALMLGIDENQQIVELHTKQVDLIYVELYTKDDVLFALLERTSDAGHYYFHIK